MTNKNPSNKFIGQPGGAAGPGRPKLPEDILQLQKQEKHWVIRKMHEIKLLPLSELRDLQKTPDTPAVTLLLISAYIRAIQGDIQAMKLILDYLIGPPPKSLIIDSNQPVQYVETVNATQVNMVEDVKKLTYDDLKVFIEERRRLLGAGN